MEEDFSKYNGKGTILRKAQLRMLAILLEVDKICKKHDIRYWLDFGTLLGAVRHGGFIPWDDDVDITVFRKDYKKLCSILKKELPDQLVMQDRTTEKNYAARYAKVRDRNSYVENINEGPRLKEEGIFIDIFYIEKVGFIGMKKVVDFFYGRCFRRIRGIAVRKKYEPVIAYCLWPFINSIILTLRILSKIIPNDLYSYSYGIPFFTRCRGKDILPLKTVHFEGISFPVPNNQENYLRLHYGDYMKIPPVDKRAIHSTKIEFKRR